MSATDTQAYIEILEKTNQQLGLWTNPYGLMVGILTLLVAFLAILFSYILWRQSKDYKQIFEAFLEERRTFIGGEIQKWIQGGQKNIDQLIQQWQNKMENLTGETRIKAEKELERLKMIRESLGDSAITASNLQKGIRYEIKPGETIWDPALSRKGDLLSDLQEQVRALLEQIAALQRRDDFNPRG